MLALTVQSGVRSISLVGILYHRNLFSRPVVFIQGIQGRKHICMYDLLVQVQVQRGSMNLLPFFCPYH